MPGLTERRRSFWRAVALGFAVILLSPLRSSSLGLMSLVGLPTAVALVARRPARAGSMAFAAGLVAAAAIGYRNPSELWYLERGWAVLIAGGFAMATALAPGRPIFERSMVAVVIALCAVAAAVWVRPELLGGLDWQITGQFDRAFAAFDLEGRRGADFADGMRQVGDVIKIVYPAMLVLASVAALGCASYVLGRLRGEEAPLAPLRQFGFSAHLVWVLVLGLTLMVLPLGVWAARAGDNIVLVMGGFYVLRGAAVLVWLGTSVISSGWSIALWVVAALLLGPVTIGTALVMGLSDTWLDLRSRLKVEAERE